MPIHTIIVYIKDVNHSWNASIQCMCVMDVLILGGIYCILDVVIVCLVAGNHCDGRFALSSSLCDITGTQVHL